METVRPVSSTSALSTIYTRNPTTIEKYDGLVSIFVQAVSDSYSVINTKIRTVSIPNSSGDCGIVEVEFGGSVGIESVADTIIASSQGRFKKWEYVSDPVLVTPIYNKYGEWDKLYFLEDEPNYFLAFNGKFLALRENA